MKRILLSTATLLLVIGVIGAGTYAYFTSTATSVDNMFSAGTLEVVLDGDVTTTAGLDLVSMAPGDQATYTIKVANAGSLDMLFKMQLVDVSETVTGFKDQLKVTATLRPLSFTEYGEYLPYGPDTSATYGPFTLAQLEDYALDNVQAWVLNDEPLWANYMAVYELVVELPWETDNTFQGAELTAKLKIDAVQSKNQDKEGTVVW